MKCLRTNQSQEINTVIVEPARLERSMSQNSKRTDLAKDSHPVTDFSQLCHKRQLRWLLFFTRETMNNYHSLSRPHTYRVESWENLEEVLVLEEVSKLTLEQPPSPPQSPSTFQTPQIRKRKPSFVVTPPRGNGCRLDFDCAAAITKETKTYIPENQDLSSLPLMPDSSALDEAPTSSCNPYKRHRPMHSPLDGFSHFNLDFVTTFQAPEDSSEQRMPAISQRRRPRRSPSGGGRRRPLASRHHSGQSSLAKRVMLLTCTPLKSRERPD